MEVRKTLKYRLYRNRRNKYLIQRIDCAGKAWNHLIELQRRYYKLTGKYAGWYMVNKHMAKLRRHSEKHNYLRMLGAQSLQDINKRHDLAYQRFFNPEIKAGRPGFKQVKKYKSFTLTQAGWKYLGANKIKIQGYTYKFSLSRPIEGKIKTVTVKRDNVGHLWVCFSVIQDIPEPIKITTGQIAGFDFGLKTFLTDSNGQGYQSPQYLKAELNEIARLNRQLAKKVKGSNNWKKAKRRLSKAHATIANKRKDSHWKLAHLLCSRYDELYFEDLNIAGMKRLWGRKVSDLGFYGFAQIIEQVAKKTGKHTDIIGRWVPSSKPCSCCGHIFDLDLSVRVIHCPDCNLILDRDWNAAINICVEGASSTSREDIRRMFAPIWEANRAILV